MQTEMHDPTKLRCAGLLRMLLVMVRADASQ